MSRRHYVNQAPQLALAANINGSVTSLTVTGTFSGWPVSYPYFAALELGGASLEIVSVTGVVGAVATIVRGQDGTSGLSHSAGATLDFVAVAADLDEANAHVNTSSGVHGIAGNVVGDTDAQTLTDKTLTNPTIDSATLTGTLVGIPTFANSITFDDDIVANKQVAGSDRIRGYLKTEHFADATTADTAYAALEVTAKQAGDMAVLDAGTTGGIGGLYFYDGSNWRPASLASGLTRVQSGTVDITPTPNTPTSIAVTFATAFSSTPVVTVAINGTVPGTVITGCSVSNISTTGCTIWVTRTNNTVTTVSWIAVN